MYVFRLIFHAHAKSNDYNINLVTAFHKMNFIE